jgi:hypothetical protein
MAVASSELGKRQQQEALVSVLRAGERIVLKSSIAEDNRIARPIFINDSRGEIKINNPNVVVFDTSRQSF